MNKLQMAHEYAMKLVGNPTTPLKTIEEIFDVSWQYADAMQAEADKREKEESEKKRADIREMLKANNTFVEREGQHFDDVEWQPDWSQAPTDACEWLMVGADSFLWRILEDGKILHLKAPSFNYQGHQKDSLRKRPQ